MRHCHRRVQPCLPLALYRILVEKENDLSGGHVGVAAGAPNASGGVVRGRRGVGARDQVGRSRAFNKVSLARAPSRSNFTILEIATSIQVRIESNAHAPMMRRNDGACSD